MAMSSVLNKIKQFIYHYYSLSILFISAAFDLNIMRSTTGKDNFNQFNTREAQIEQLIDSRYTHSDQQAEWIYEKEVRDMYTKNKYKYQDVNMSVKIGFLQDMKGLIYDQKSNPEDLSIFTADSKWKLVGFQQQEFNVPESVPSAALLKKVGESGERFDDFWGKVELEGRMNIKTNQIGYNPKLFNLRNKAIFFYPIEIERQEKQQLMIELNQTAFNFQLESQEYFGLKTGQRVVKIRKDAQSRQALKLIQRTLLLCSFRGAFCLRNETPSHQVHDYITKEIDIIKGIDFVHEQKVKDIVGARYYKEAIGGFFYLLNRQSFKHKTLSMQLTFPRWLKNSFKTIPNCDLNLITNVVPNKLPLMNLKIKLHQSQIGTLNENLKYIFPFRRDYIRRTLVVYESNLQDNHVNYMMNQISYPMSMIGLPKNQLSILGLEYVINAAGTLCQETVDFSYNSKLISISGPKVFSLTNANPSLKKLILKGCYISLGEQGEFFQGLASNMCLKEFQIDYMDSYNDSMIKHLDNYDGQII